MENSKKLEHRGESGRQAKGAIRAFDPCPNHERDYDLLRASADLCSRYRIGTQTITVEETEQRRVLKP